MLYLKARLSMSVVLHWGLEHRYHNLRVQNPPKPPKIDPNRRFPANMPKSYNGSISKTLSPIKL